MNNDLTQLGIILDRSGSMEDVRQVTIDSCNEYINGQKQVPGRALLRFVQFDEVDPQEVIYDGLLDSAPPLTAKTFVPRGGTPLHDAMGMFITNLGHRLRDMPERERPGRVIVVTITDGFENASREFTRQRVAECINHQRTTYNWQFIFLGASQDAVLTAAGFGIPAMAALTFNKSLAGTASSFGSTNSYTTNLRNSVDPQSMNDVSGFTQAEREEAEK